MSIDYQETSQELEIIVDRVGIVDVLGMLMEICHGKAEHLLTNWQDPAMAKRWKKCGVIIDKATAKVQKLQP